MIRFSLARSIAWAVLVLTQAAPGVGAQVVGQTSVPSPPSQSLTQPIATTELVFQEVDGIVAVEAEHFLSQTNDDVCGWYRVEQGQVPQIDPDFDGPHLVGSSGGRYLEALPDSRATDDDPLKKGINFFPQPGQAGLLTYKVHFDNPGRYYVWVRHLSTGSEDNGLHVGLDGTWPESGQRWQTTKKRRWAWESRQRTDKVHAGVRYGLYLDIAQPGEHEIHFSIREDGFEFDKFVLASDRDFTPQDLGPASKVRAGTAPRPQPLSADYKEAPVPVAESKAKNAAKVGYQFKASKADKETVALTQPITSDDLVLEEVDGLVAVEAEHFIEQQKHEIRAWFRVSENQVPLLKPDIDTPHLIGASNAGYLEALPDSRWTHGQALVFGENFFDDPGMAGVLTYNIHFNHPGRYYVWVHHYSTGSEDNGLHVGLDRQWPASGQRWQTTIKRRWAWESRQRTEEAHEGVPFALYLDVPTAGLHRVHFSIREDGLEFDKFILSSDRDYRPQGIGQKSVVKQGELPPRQTLSSDYQQEDLPDAEPAPLVTLPKGTVRIAAPEFEIDGSNFYVDQKKWLAINPNHHKTATASVGVTATPGNYLLVFHAVGENDGESEFLVEVDGGKLGTFTCPLSIDTFELGRKFTKEFANVAVEADSKITVTAKVGSADGTEYSRGRWLGVTLLPPSATAQQVDSARREFDY